MARFGRLRPYQLALGVILALAAFAGRFVIPSTDSRFENPTGDPPSRRCSVLRVVDGDTLRVNCAGRRESVRLLQIDAPEHGTAGHREATATLRRLVGGRVVELELNTPPKKRRDRYGRLLAYVFVQGENINVALVRRGVARYWTRYGRGPYSAEFVVARAEARADRRRGHKKGLNTNE